MVQLLSYKVGLQLPHIKYGAGLVQAPRPNIKYGALHTSYKDGAVPSYKVWFAVPHIKYGAVTSWFCSYLI